MTSIISRINSFRLALGATVLTLMASTASADQVINDDLIVRGSICGGFDCVNGESFGFDTLRLKENNLRLHFDDTSTSASFPRNDWRFIANDSSNGGGSYMAIEDSTAARQVFRVEAGARSNALYVESDGDIGIGTNNPAVDIDIKTGNTPTVRLQQDGTSGFTPQTWDVAGNETNFFIRDVTNGSLLPFRIRPDAPTSSIFIDTNGNVGLGTSNPLTEFFIEGDNDKARIRLSTTDAAEDDLLMNWKDESFRISLVSTPVTEFRLNASGDVTITGSLTTGGAGACSGTPCDAVFDPSVYTVPSIEDHAAVMWQNKHLPAVGPTSPDQPVNMTEKMLRILNELEHAHIYIEQMHYRIEQLERLIDPDKG